MGLVRFLAIGLGCIAKEYTRVLFSLFFFPLQIGLVSLSFPFLFSSYYFCFYFPLAQVSRQARYVLGLVACPSNRAYSK